MNELMERANGELVWTPTSEPTWPLDRWLNRLWNEAFVSFTPGTFLRDGGVGFGQFRTEVADRGDAFEVTVILPGIPKERISVRVQGTLLKVRVEDSTDKVENLNGSSVQDKRLVLYERTFELPEPTPASAITARAENGVLTVRVPKPQPIPEEQVPLA